MENEVRSNSYKRVALNTLSLYIRMAVLTIISLYTVRVVFNVLGADDYGIYSVIGGLVTMFSFISSTLTNASQRYFSYYLADENWDNLNKYFSLNCMVYFLLIIFSSVFLETVGNWVVLNKLNIQTERMDAVMWVYQFSILTFIFGIIAAPYQAFLVADENLKIYSIISIFEGGMKLLIAFVLNVTRADKLIIYAFLVFLVSFGTTFFYIGYCLLKYKKLKLKFIREKSIYKEVFSFIGWNFIGSIASIGKGQGINIIINMFFGSIVNASRGIASQVNNTVMSFAQNFMKAVQPQITKAYANEEKNRFLDMISFASKLSYFLLFFVALPLICNLDFVINLWLGDVPRYTVIFIKLALVDTLIGCITEPICTAVQATGNVKWYQIIVGGMNLLNLPFTFIVLKITENPIYPFIISIILSIGMGVARIILFSNVYEFSFVKYFNEIILPSILMTSVSSSINFIFFSGAIDFIELIIKVFFSLVVNISLFYVIGLNSSEKNIIIKTIKLKFRKEKINE